MEGTKQGGEQGRRRLGWQKSKDGDKEGGQPPMLNHLPCLHYKAQAYTTILRGSGCAHESLRLIHTPDDAAQLPKSNQADRRLQQIT